MKAFIFPGQGAQFVGMGKDLFVEDDAARILFEKANEVMEFRISDLMFAGTDEDLRQTKITQPAIFIHSVATFFAKKGDQLPGMVAGHSLGEFSALVAAAALSFEDGLRLVQQRALAMQEACDIEPSTMAAIIGLENEVVEEVCAAIEEVVVPANYNSPGQVVISGSIDGIHKACELLKEKGAKRALPLKVGGAFHSPLMEPAREKLAIAIKNTHINKPICPIYQNATALGSKDPAVIKENLIAQLTAPVKWAQSVENMVKDGASSFTESGPGTVLSGLVSKISKGMEAYKL